MKTIFSFLFLWLISISVSAHPTGGSRLYGQTIYLSNTDDAATLRAVKDLQDYLGGSTGKTFRTETFNGQKNEGIYLLLNETASVPSSLRQKLQNGTIEDFVLSGDDKQLQVLATHPKGITLGIYTYLDKLGFKWYFPGDEWMYLPSLNSITLPVQQFFTPSFHLRNFFGTGSILPAKSLDPEGALAASWEDWKRRNRMGGEVAPGGHYGETFNLKYKDLLQAHPEYLALVGGKRVPWTTEAKWCVSNKELRAVYLKDRVEELTSRLKTTRYKNEKILVSVDPADGYGDCECGQCKKLGSPSNRYFLMANEVAKAIKPLSPQAFANIYAYNTHSSVPSFPLSPNLLVQVIPYAFQTESKPHDLIRAWKTHHTNLMIYDYYGIPDWHFDLPLTGMWSPEALAAKMKFWENNNIRGFMLESSFSSASAGPGLYLASRLGWDSKENVTGIFSGMLHQLFGKAAPEAKKYFSKIASYRGAIDLPYLVDVLDKADRLERDAGVQKKLVALKSYIHFLVLYYAWQEAPAERKEEALETLMAYNWSAYNWRMVHTTRIGELLAAKTTDPAFSKRWNIFEPLGTRIKSLKLIDAKGVQDFFERDKKAFPLQQGMTYTTPQKASVFVNKAVAAEEPSPAGIAVTEFPETYVRPSGDGFVRFQLKVNEGSANNKQQSVDVTLTDTADGKEVFVQSFNLDANWKKIAVKVPAGKTLKLFVKNSNWIRLYFPPSQWAAFKTIPTYSQMGKLWFYVAPGTSFFYFSNNAADQPVFNDPGGKTISPERAKGNTFRVPVSKEAAGKWWSVSSTEYKTLQFFLEPGLFFTHPGYTVQ